MPVKSCQLRGGGGGPLFGGLKAREDRERVGPVSLRWREDTLWHSWPSYGPFAFALKERLPLVPTSERLDLLCRLLSGSETTYHTKASPVVHKRQEPDWAGSIKGPKNL
jgi:hypothetical protein